MDDLAFEQHMKDIADAVELENMFREVDSDGSNTISVEEFRQLTKHPKLKAYLQVRGIDIKNTEMFFLMLRALGGEAMDVDIHTMVNACLRMKGYASSLDLQGVSFESKMMAQRQQKHFNASAD